MAEMTRIGTWGVALAGLTLLAGCDLVKFPGFGEQPVAETRDARRVPPPPPLEPVNPIEISEDFWAEDLQDETSEPASQVFGGPAAEDLSATCDEQAEPCEP